MIPEELAVDGPLLTFRRWLALAPEYRRPAPELAALLAEQWNLAALDHLAVALLARGAHRRGAAAGARPADRKILEDVQECGAFLRRHGHALPPALARAVELNLPRRRGNPADVRQRARLDAVADQFDLIEMSILPAEIRVRLKPGQPPLTAEQAERRWRQGCRAGIGKRKAEIRRRHGLDGSDSVDRQIKQYRAKRRNQPPE